MPPAAKQPIKRPAIEARVSPISWSKMATYGNNPWMKMASRNTAAKQTLARGSANTPWKFATTAARLNGGGANFVLRSAQNANTETARENVPRIAKTPRQPNRSPITPAIEAPSTLAVSAIPRRRAIAT